MSRSSLLETRLVKATEAIYDAAADPAGWPRALGAISEYFGDVGAILIWYRDNGSFGTIVSEGLAAAQRDYEENGWASRDIKAIRAQECGYFFSGEPFADRHIGFDEEMKNHPCSTQFFAKHGLGWIGAVAVSPDPHVGVMLSVQRDARSKEQFSDEELESLRLISRNVEKSLRLSVKLLNAEVVNIGLGEALARIGIGVFALDSKASIIFSNIVAQQRLGDAVQVVRGRLRIGDSSTAARLDEAISQSLNGMPPESLADVKPLLVEASASNRRFAIYLLPIFQPILAERFLTHTRVIVLVIEQKLDEPADPAIVRDLFGLTLGEAKIAAMIGAGLSPRDAAQKLGIKEESARTVLKSVFSKTGISRQSELVALLSKLLR